MVRLLLHVLTRGPIRSHLPLFRTLYFNQVPKGMVLPQKGIPVYYNQRYLWIPKDIVFPQKKYIGIQQSLSLVP